MAFNPSELINKALSIGNPDPSKAGSTLLILNALGMVFAAASNTFAAAKDKNTSAEDKKFLVPAGVATGVVNIGIYFAMTKKMIEHLQGVIKYKKDGSIKKTIKGVADYALDNMGADKIKENATEFVTESIQKAEKGGFLGFGKKPDEYIASMKKNLLPEMGEITKKGIDLYKSNFKSGFGVVGAFAGAIIGCAILTPVIRDLSAYAVQKYMEKKNPNMKDKPYMPYFDPSHTKFGYNNSVKKQALNMKNYMAFTNGGMKI